MPQTLDGLIIAIIEFGLDDERATIMAMQTVPTSVRTAAMLGITILLVLGLLTALGIDIPRLIIEPALIETRGGKVRFW